MRRPSGAQRGGAAARRVVGDDGRPAPVDPDDPDGLLADEGDPRAVRRPLRIGDRVLGCGELAGQARAEVEDRRSAAPRPASVVYAMRRPSGERRGSRGESTATICSIVSRSRRARAGGTGRARAAGRAAAAARGRVRHGLRAGGSTRVGGGRGRVGRRRLGPVLRTRRPAAPARCRWRRRGVRHGVLVRRRRAGVGCRGLERAGCVGEERLLGAVDAAGVVGAGGA